VATARSWGKVIRSEFLTAVKMKITVTWSVAHKVSQASDTAAFIFKIRYILKIPQRKST